MKLSIVRLAVKLAVVLVLLEGLSPLFAQQREFSDATGKFKVHAELLDFQDGQVTLKRTDDGRVISLPIESLSPACQQFIQSQSEQSGVVQLEETVAEIVRQLSLDGVGAGIVAKISGKRVYVSLGEQDGMQPGAELAIVGPAEVLGNLAVVSVQERLSVCRLVEGHAQQQDADGRYQRVVRIEDAEGIPVSLGPIQLPAEAGIPQDSLTNALLNACREQGLFRVVGSAASPAYELNLVGEPSPGGIRISVTVTDRRSRASLATASGLCRTGKSLGGLGYRAAMVGELGAALRMDPVRRAFENRNIQIQDAGDTLFLKDAGARGESAWIFPSGRIVTAVSKDINDPRNLRQLSQTWNEVARTIAGVSADVNASEVDQRLQESSEVYTQQANQLQSLSFRNQASASGWRLTWPDAKVSWASLVATGSNEQYSANIISIGERQRISNATGEIQEVSIADLQFGDHSVAITRASGIFGRQPLHFQIAAFFPQPSGRIAMYDSAGSPTATREILSKPLDSLYLPMPPQ